MSSSIFIEYHLVIFDLLYYLYVHYAFKDFLIAQLRLNFVGRFLGRFSPSLQRF